MIVKFGGYGNDFPLQAFSRRRIDGRDCSFFGLRSCAEVRKAVKGGKTFQEIAEAQAFKEFSYVSLTRLGLELVDGIGQVEVAANVAKSLDKRALSLLSANFS